MNTEKIPTVLPYIHAEAETNTEEQKVVTFTKEQKEHINDTFRERYKEIQTAAEKKLAEERKKWEADFEARLEARLAEQSGSKKKATGEAAKSEGEEEHPQLAEYQRIAREAKRAAEERDKALAAAKNDIVTRDAQILEMKKQNAISSAVSGLDFIDIAAVEALTTKYVQYDADSGRFIVLNKDGEIMQGDDFKPIGLKEYYARFAEEKPYLVKSSARGGQGSTPGNGPTGTGVFSHIKTRADFGKDHKLRAQYIEKYKMEGYLKLPPK